MWIASAYPRTNIFAKGRQGGTTTVATTKRKKKKKNIISEPTVQGKLGIPRDTSATSFMSEKDRHNKDAGERETSDNCHNVNNGSTADNVNERDTTDPCRVTFAPFGSIAQPPTATVEPAPNPLPTSQPQRQDEESSDECDDNANFTFVPSSFGSTGDGPNFVEEEKNKENAVGCDWIAALGNQTSRDFICQGPSATVRDACRKSCNICENLSSPSPFLNPQGKSSSAPTNAEGKSSSAPTNADGKSSSAPTNSQGKSSSAPTAADGKIGDAPTTRPPSSVLVTSTPTSADLILPPPSIQPTTAGKVTPTESPTTLFPSVYSDIDDTNDTAIPSPTPNPTIAATTPAQTPLPSTTTTASSTPTTTETPTTSEFSNSCVVDENGLVGTRGNTEDEKSKDVSVSYRYELSTTLNSNADVTSMVLPSLNQAISCRLFASLQRSPPIANDIGSGAPNSFPDNALAALVAFQVTAAATIDDTNSNEEVVGLTLAATDQIIGTCEPPDGAISCAIVDGTIVLHVVGSSSSDNDIPQRDWAELVQSNLRQSINDGDFNNAHPSIVGVLFEETVPSPLPTSEPSSTTTVISMQPASPQPQATTTSPTTVPTVVQPPFVSAAPTTARGAPAITPLPTETTSALPTTNMPTSTAATNTTSECDVNEDGFFGSRGAPNATLLQVNFRYQVMSAPQSNSTFSSVVLPALERAITCAVVPTVSTPEQDIVMGVDALPEDIPTGDPCEVPSNSAISCFVLNGRLTLFLDTAERNDTLVDLDASLQSALNTSMSADKLNDAHPSIVTVRYLGPWMTEEPTSAPSRVTSDFPLLIDDVMPTSSDSDVPGYVFGLIVGVLFCCCFCLCCLLLGPCRRQDSLEDEALDGNSGDQDGEARNKDDTRSIVSVPGAPNTPSSKQESTVDEDTSVPSPEKLEVARSRSHDSEKLEVARSRSHDSEKLEVARTRSHDSVLVPSKSLSSVAEHSEYSGEPGGSSVASGMDAENETELDAALYAADGVFSSPHDADMKNQEENQPNMLDEEGVESRASQGEDEHDDVEHDEVSSGARSDSELLDPPRIRWDLPNTLSEIEDDGAEGDGDIANDSEDISERERGTDEREANAATNITPRSSKKRRASKLLARLSFADGFVPSLAALAMPSSSTDSANVSVDGGSDR